MTSFPSDATDLPLISVVVSTRNRGASLARTVRGILANDPPQMEVIVVDQSDDEQTATALGPLLDDGRVRLVRTSTRGLSLGRNLGIRHARSEFIALTDDDCDVAADWLQAIRKALAADSRIGLVFGNVLAGLHDPAAGFITAYVRSRPVLARSIHGKRAIEGVGACMGLRRSVWQTVHGFDPALGIGGPLLAGEEGDLAVRILLAGYWVYEVPAVTVTHQGFCAWADRPTVVYRNWFGSGAVLGKQFRCGHWFIIPLLLGLAYRWAFGVSPVAVSLGRTPSRLRRLAAFLQGFWKGTITPVDRSTGHFAPQRLWPPAGK
jgi:GT2 family glycosyltransferase